MKNWTYRILLIPILFFALPTLAQIERDDRATIVNFKGVQFKSADSSLYINFRFRMQNRLKYTTFGGDDFGVKEFEARVRRLRLRMDGYIYNPKLTYSIQLAFTRGDMDIDDSGYPNIVRDAVVFYNFTDNFYVSFGMNKLPGNRQRVNSSGALQFAERSLVNANFNVDRDFGLKAYYQTKIGQVPLHLAGAISTGEGRVADKTNDGLAYTGRLEFLPLGEFTNDGDYFEGDLEREPTPKLSIGGGMSFNQGAIRSRGQTGKNIPNPRDLKTTFIDAIFKYNGWAYQAEYMRLDVDDPVQFDAEQKAVYSFKGQGLNQQLSYLISDKEGYEVALRHTLINTHKDIRALEPHRDIMEVGVTKYFRAHRLKIQLNAGYNANNGKFGLKEPGNHWIGTFQVELGI